MLPALPPHARRSARLALVLALAAPLARAQAPQEATGFQRLAARLGAGGFPTGAGVPFGQIEAPEHGAFAPDASDPEFSGKTFVHKSGDAGGASVHATLVGEYGYGLQSSIAPGVGLIDSWDANHWLGDGFLNGSGPKPPELAGAKVLSHSWIGSAGAANDAYLRKLDAAIEAQGLVVCAGVGNGRGPLDVALLSHAFNTISVGRSDGLHRAGDTSSVTDGAGRMKPELVAPASATSFATPLVAGAAALLVETAWRDPRLAGDPRASRPETIKAVLMAGASKPEGWSNSPVPGGASRGASSKPLDPLLGAGQIDVDASHWILTAGEQPAAPSAARAQGSLLEGWSSVEIAAGQSRWLRFRVEARKPTVSIVAAWNRAVSPDFAAWTLADVDLELWGVDARGAPVALVGAPARERFAGGNVLSDSAADNVEHLHVLGLEPGEYLLELRRDQDGLGAARVALAWRFAGVAPRAFCDSRSARGAAPSLSWTGFPSLRGQDFELAISHGRPQANGLVYLGLAHQETPFSGGASCLRWPSMRFADVRLGSYGCASVPVAILPSMVGQELSFQAVLRAAGDAGLEWTNGVEVQFAP